MFKDLAIILKGVIAISPMALEMIKNSAEDPILRNKISRKYRSLFSQSVSSLTPKIDQAGFQHLFQALTRELRAKKIEHLKIEAYFGDEWFCPDQSTVIAIPFWLADERLKSIERALVGYVEGERPAEFMKLLRHEAGHCMEHAYRLSKREDWKRIFGNPKIEYNPEAQKTYRNHPDFVRNLPDGYAQTHPEEDFAETFAVWLNPKSNWRVKYRNMPMALYKIQFVEKLMNEVSTKIPKKISNQKIYQARRMKKSLEAYYSERLRVHLN